MYGRIFNIMRYSIHDGPGIRTTVFMKGCPLSCVWCHNPESISPDVQIVLNENLCIKCWNCIAVCPQYAISRRDDLPVVDDSKCNLCGKCVEGCNSGALEMIGRDYSVSMLFDEILKDKAFYERSGGGVTFSGGEPLLQHEFLFEMLEACRAAGIHCSVDTSGYAAKDVITRIAGLTDLFLYDVKIVNDARHRRYTGVPSTPILDNLRMLDAQGSSIIVRFPLIPGINDDDENVRAVGNVVRSLKPGTVCSVLPYHRIGVDKYRRLGVEYKFIDSREPDAAVIDRVAKVLGEYVKELQIGG